MAAAAAAIAIIASFSAGAQDLTPSSKEAGSRSDEQDYRWGRMRSMDRGMGMMDHGFMGSGMGWGRHGDSPCTSRIEGRLAYLKAELRLTKEQETLWETYAAAARKNANAMMERCTATASKRGASMSLPEQIDQHEQWMTLRLEALRAQNKALKPLYAALSDNQKKTADQLF